MTHLVRGIASPSVKLTGAVLSRVLYSRDERWSFANVATLAGIHLSVPVPTNTSTGAPVPPPQGFSLFEDLPVAFDARGQWGDAPNATAWALANLHPMCNKTESLVVLQVSHAQILGAAGVPGTRHSECLSSHHGFGNVMEEHGPSSPLGFKSQGPGPFHVARQQVVGVQILHLLLKSLIYLKFPDGCLLVILHGSKHPVIDLQNDARLASLPRENFMSLHPTVPACNSVADWLLQDPGLLHAGYLADLVAARQLFAFHMPDMCVANSTSAALFDTIAEAARSQGSLLSVMGYFPQQEVHAFTLHCIDNNLHPDRS